MIAIDNKKNVRKADNINLRDFLNNLSVIESPKMARRLAKECKVPMYTFNNWRTGIARIPELAKDKIEEVAGEKIFDRDDQQ
ncbi:hypothetical protein EZS27_004297 [termite gut metagenome]|uniref:HTH cro/C1-type domain-containing protein n=1 Tax=termite gut metagenome TaxID=433724 RepID=A0A5J4SPP6_9ZZZZ